MAIHKIRGPQFKVLSDDQVQDIHWGTLRVLEEVGVRVEYKPALQLMADNGCIVDFHKRIVKIPEYVLKRALEMAPSRFTLYGRVPKFDVHVDTQSIYTIGAGSGVYILDLNGNRRRPTFQDLVDIIRIQDALEHPHIPMRSMVMPEGMSTEGSLLIFSAELKNTVKNFYSQVMNGGQEVRDQVRIASIILGGEDKFKEKPFFTECVCMISPLVQPPECVEVLMESAKYGIPIYVEVDALPGATTPVTLAGTLVEQNANILCGITLAQMVKSGTPCIYAIASAIMDMATGNYSGAAPDTDLLHAATAQIAHFYNLPCLGATSIDALFPDAQAGYERALQDLTCALFGVNFLHLTVGHMEQMDLFSYEECIIDNEILEATFHIIKGIKGIEVNENTMAIDVIKEVGPGGSYITHKHTLEHFRKVRWFPKITVRDKWEEWKIKGEMDIRKRANAEAKRILKEHHPRYLSKEVEMEIDKIVTESQRKMVHRI